MATRKVEKGKRYGDLKIIQDLGYTKSRHHYYLCYCYKCSNTVKMPKDKLTQKSTTCCTECQKDKKYINRIINGYEVVRKLRSGIWECRCQQCGRVRNVSDRKLKSGKISKCYCELLKKDVWDMFL